MLGHKRFFTKHLTVNEYPYIKGTSKQNSTLIIEIILYYNIKDNMRFMYKQMRQNSHITAII